MDGSELFQTVLNPGERLLWTGQPRQLQVWIALLQYVVMVLGLGSVFRKLLIMQTSPLPVFLQVELIGLVAIVIIPGFFLAYLLGRNCLTAYALTNLRLLMAVGPRREKIRTVALAALAPVEVVYRHRIGKVLSFKERTPGSGKPLWTFLDTGQADKRRSAWYVHDPESVRRLIENARTARRLTAA